MTDTETKWHYAISSQIHGPLTVDEIAKKLSEGDISEITQVCQVGSEKWERLRDSLAWQIITKPKPVEQTAEEAPSSHHEEAKSTRSENDHIQDSEPKAEKKETVRPGLAVGYLEIFVLSPLLGLAAHFMSVATDKYITSHIIFGMKISYVVPAIVFYYLIELYCKNRNRPNYWFYIMYVTCFLVSISLIRIAAVAN